MKKVIIILLVILFAFLAFIVFKKTASKKAEAAPKVVFAYFSGYRCPPCMVFERDFLEDFQKTYKEKYNGRVELKIYKVDIPLHIAKNSPEYEPAKKLADRNSVIHRATSKLNNADDALPYAIIGETSLDYSGDDFSVNAENVERAIKQALEHNETTKLADSVSGKMRDYATIEEAARAGDYKAVEEFFKNNGDGDKNEALSIASFNGYLEIVKLLVSHGADANSITKYSGSALASAAFMGRYEVVEFLLSKGADIKSKNNIIADAGIDENMVILLKNHGADINGKLKSGHTPLTNVIIIREKRSGAEIAIKYADMLIRQGADVNQEVTIEGENGKTVTKTPLQLAQSKEMKDFLISKGAK
ncbi:MAG: ankyrin repeat domain-containing protein [Elusimicrobiota bacterium]|jgi:ankyrin repeat protein|nr:ankyrin repeat domain-containing protein [Elusimicrobiota bacterium]